MGPMLNTRTEDFYDSIEEFRLIVLDIMSVKKINRRHPLLGRDNLVCKMQPAHTQRT